MRRTLTVHAVAALVWAAAVVLPVANPIAAETPAAGLHGTAHGPDGGPLGGVAVFTDAGGEYVFPALEPGPHRLWPRPSGLRRRARR